MIQAIVPAAFCICLLHLKKTLMKAETLNLWAIKSKQC